MSSLLILDMDFPLRLASFRKQRGLTQQALAEMVGVRVLCQRAFRTDPLSSVEN